MLFIAILACAAMIGLTPAFASADSGIEYLDASGQRQVCQNCQPYKSETTELNGGWYYVSGEKWCDNSSIGIPSGIQVPGGSKLTVYAQSTGESKGRLSCSAGSRNAGTDGYKPLSKNVTVKIRVR